MPTAPFAAMLVVAVWPAAKVLKVPLTANSDVEVAFVRLRFVAVRVPVAVMFAAKMSPEKRPLPCTESTWVGLVVPTPKKPELLMRIFSMSLMATANGMTVVGPVTALTYAP
jgi:hypothetical protein